MASSATHTLSSKRGTENKNRHSETRSRVGHPLLPRAINLAAATSHRHTHIHRHVERRGNGALWPDG